MLILFIFTMSVCTCRQIFSGIAREGGGEVASTGRVAPPPEKMPR